MHQRKPKERDSLPKETSNPPKLISEVKSKSSIIPAETKSPNETLVSYHALKAEHNFERVSTLHADKQFIEFLKLSNEEKRPDLTDRLNARLKEILNGQDKNQILLLLAPLEHFTLLNLQEKLKTTNDIFSAFISRMFYCPNLINCLIILNAPTFCRVLQESPFDSLVKLELIGKWGANNHITDEKKIELAKQYAELQSYIPITSPATAIPTIQELLQLQKIESAEKLMSTFIFAKFVRRTYNWPALSSFILENTNEGVDVHWKVALKVSAYQWNEQKTIGTLLFPEFQIGNFYFSSQFEYSTEPSHPGRMLELVLFWKNNEETEIFPPRPSLDVSIVGKTLKKGVHLLEKVKAREFERRHFNFHPEMRFRLFYKESKMSVEDFVHEDHDKSGLLFLSATIQSKLTRS